MDTTSFLCPMAEDFKMRCRSLSLLGEGQGEGIGTRQPQLLLFVFECHSPPTELKSVTYVSEHL